MRPELEKYLVFPDVAEDLDGEQRELIDDSWQGGVEQLGFLFELDDRIVMRELVPQITGYLTLLRAQEPSQDVARSPRYEEDRKKVVEQDRDRIRTYMGALLGEVAIENGWTWCATAEHGLLVKNKTGFALRVFPLMTALIDASEPVELVDAAATWFAEHGDLV